MGNSCLDKARCARCSRQFDDAEAERRSEWRSASESWERSRLTSARFLFGWNRFEGLIKSSTRFGSVAELFRGFSVQLTICVGSLRHAA